MRTLLLLSTLLCSCHSGGPGWPDAPAPATESPELQLYKQRYDAALGTQLTATLTRAEVLAEIAGTRVLWLGDQHTDAGLHARQRELLAELVARGERPVLVLEAVGAEDDAALARFLTGQWSLPELRLALAVRWPGSWLDAADVDAAHYRALLAFAAREHLPVHGLEPTPRLPLAERDPHIATRVHKLAAQHPDRLLVVVVGTAHLAGAGDLVRRVGLPAVAVAAGLPERLATPAAAAAEFVRSDRGFVFWSRLRPGP